MQAGEASRDKITSLTLSLAFLPLARPISDAKVLTGRQKPMTQIAFLFAEINTAEGHQGVGYSYSKRAGGRGHYAHAKEIADVNRTLDATRARKVLDYAQRYYALRENMRYHADFFLARLRQVKQTYDPDFRFRFAQAIPPAG